MPRKISKNPVKRKRATKRHAKLEQQGRVVNGVEIPRDAIPGDLSRQNLRGGFTSKPYYQDIEYRCAGCGKHEVWTAHQQKKYFEIQKGNIYNRPKWCYDCHQARLREKRRKY